MSHRLCQECDDWTLCTLCRAGRLGVYVHNKAAAKRVEWPAPNQGISAHIEEPVIHTSLEDACESMLQFLRISCKKCHRYHHSHQPFVKGSASDVHLKRFHSRKHPSSTEHQSSVLIKAAPGTYTVTASGREGRVSTTHVVDLLPGKAVTFTI
ncbi:uncharacterized protein [Dysidea avara]|uniref:uncharacterized protein n=1 Tax=Dysidea avara TaxID=196820 RepID=UPI00332C3934